jgi:Domain of unknown function (DUF4915)
MHNLTLAGCPVHLVASCLGDGDTGGGLFYYDGEDWVQLDDVSTTGLFVCGDQLIRMLWAPRQVAHATAVLHYSASGLERHLRVDGLTDPHDVLWDGVHYIAVSSIQDAIVWVTPEGTVKRRYQPGAGDDCWHLNCLLLHDGVLYATAFGRFAEPRGWMPYKLAGTGMLFRADTGEDILSGICCPHTPRRFGGQWMLCSSATSELLLFAGDRETPAARVRLQDWVRGLSWSDRYIFAGESVNRQLTREARNASVAVLERATLSLVERLTLPCREVYDLRLVSTGLLKALQHAPSPRRLWHPPEIRRIPPAAARAIVDQT